jgi:Mlc titration factor MtfA (ptsG expression regulator)
MAAVIRFLRKLFGPGPRAAPTGPPADWRALVAGRVPQVGLLDGEQRALFDARVEQFLNEKRFVGCAGLEVTDEMRVLVAALACLLILRPHSGVFARLRSVLLYPDAFLVPPMQDEMGLVSEEPEERIGESWGGDRVILSWPEVQAAAAGQALNVVAHEFAHQLDDHKGGREGAPESVDAKRWAEVMNTEYERLQRHRRPPVLDPYGAQSPAEFFAVATEAFFQSGAELAQHHPELYALLRDYYRLETAKLETGSRLSPG